MPGFAFLLFMYSTEWLIVYTYAKSIYEKRNRYSTLISILLFSVLMLVYRFLTNIEILNVFFTLVCDILCVYLCFKSTLKSAFFHGLALGISQYVSELVAIYLTSQITETPHNLYHENELLYIIDVVVSKLIYFSICRLLSKFSNKETFNKNWGKWVSLALLPISSLLILCAIRVLTQNVIFSQKENVFCIISLIMLLVANVIVYVIYERSEKSNQKLIELELAEQKNEINMQYLQLLETKNEKMNIMSHDYKNHLITISNMCDSQEVKDYINDMVDDISKYNRIAKTKNKWLDIILNKYTDMCDVKNITFEINVSTDNLSFINSYDMSALFNNILDNAYEAALSSQEKHIYLEIGSVLGSYHKIIIKNSSDIEPQTKNDKLITTKKNKETHGFGTKSITKIVNKYSGELQWEYLNDIKQFKLTILFPFDVK